MLNPRLARRVSALHRLLGLAALVPLLGWVGSSFVLHGAGLALPNGLQGVYTLEPGREGAERLTEPGIIDPAVVLKTLRDDGIERVYWLRLEPLAGRPVYVVKPDPAGLERVYDALTGRRLDPLPDSMLRAIADEELAGTAAVDLHAGDEFNRYYALARVPAVAARMQGAQPSELILSRASGRVLRRTDPLAAAFEKAYRSVHVWQWGASVRVFTALLYSLVGVTLLVVALGSTLWVHRRPARRRWTPAVRPARRLHPRLAPFAAVVLSTQMLVGAYLWYNLGLIEPRFRGQGSFRSAWSGGIGVTERPAPLREILDRADPASTAELMPLQRVEWRAAGERRTWILYGRRDREGVLLDAATGERLARLSAEEARAAAEGVTAGSVVGPAAESTEYWMDYNARIPTYLFRFDDPDRSDVHVSQVTGEVIQRRPAVWRRFGPFLAYHTFGFTGNPWLDTALLSVLQAVVLAMAISGWRLAGVGRRRRPT